MLFGEEVTIGFTISSQVNEDVLSVSESKRFDDSLMLNDSNNDVLKLGIPHELVLSMQCIFDCSCSYILRGTNLRNYHMQLLVDSILQLYYISCMGTWVFVVLDFSHNPLIVG